MHRTARRLAFLGLVFALMAAATAGGSLAAPPSPAPKPTPSARGTARTWPRQGPVAAATCAPANATPSRAGAASACSQRAAASYPSSAPARRVGGLPAVTSTLALGLGAPLGSAVDTTSHLLYVADSAGPFVDVIDTAHGNAILQPILVGGAPSSVAIDQSTHRVYVSGTNSASGGSVIDTTNNNLVSTITGTAFGNCDGALAVDSMHHRAYLISGCNSTQVYVIDGASKAVVGTGITLASPASAITVDPTTQLVYVATASNNSVSVIDTQTGNTVTTITNAALCSPYGLDINPTTHLLYVSSTSHCPSVPPDGTVDVFDTANSNALVGTPIAMSGPPGQLAVDATANKVVVLEDNVGMLSVIDAGNNNAVASVALTSLENVSLDPSTHMAYVSQSPFDSVVAIAYSSMPAISATISGSNGAADVTVNPATGLAYVVNNGSSSVSVINPMTNTTVGQPIPVGSNPSFSAFDPATGKLYVANTGSSSVSVIDTQTGNSVTTITDASICTPQGIGVNSITDTVYVASTCSTPGTIVTIDGASGTVTGTPITVGSQPGDLAVNSTTGKVYVDDYLVGTVTVIDTANANAVTTIPIISPANGFLGGIDVNPVTNRAYVAVNDCASFPSCTASLVTIDGASNAITGSPIIVPVSGTHPAAADDVAVNPVTNTAWVTDQTDGFLFDIDLAAGQTLASLTVPCANFAGVNPATNTIFATDNCDNTVFTVAGGPAITSLSPSSAPAAGGTPVMITGAHLSQTSAVLFGSTNVTFSIGDDQHLSVTSPAGVGAVNVSIVAGGQPSGGSPASRFGFIPSVTGVSPASGPTGGGTLVQISGTGFDSMAGNTSVSFGSVVARLVRASRVNGQLVLTRDGGNTQTACPSSTTCYAQSPAGSGTVDVRVATAGGQSPVALADSFQYVAAPAITNVSPNSGVTSGGTAVTIIGTGFTGATQVLFGATAAAFTITDANHIQATSPSGTGTVDVQVTTPDGSSPTGATSDQFTFASVTCTNATLAASPTAQAPAGTSVLLTATSGACTTAQYEFWELPPGGTWQVLQPYSGQATASWNTPATAGSYVLAVWVRAQNSGATFDTWASLPYTLTAGCSTPSLSASPASPLPADQDVTLAASASGCAQPLYQFWLLPPSGTWQVIGSYGAQPSVLWHLAGEPVGSYTLALWVKDASSPAAYDSFVVDANPFVLTAAEVTLGATPAAGVALGTPVGLTATAPASLASPEYAFWALAPGGTWQVLGSGYSASGTASFATAGQPAGAYWFAVWVKAAGSPNAYDRYQLLGDYVVAPAVTLTPSPPASVGQTAGQAVQLSVSQVGLANPEYEFWVLAPGGSWQLLGSGYSASATASWTPAVAGSYSLAVWVRNVGSPNAYDGFAGPLTYPVH